MDFEQIAAEIAREFVRGTLSGANRPMRVVIGDGRANPLQGKLLVQSIDIRERLNHGIEGHVTCVSTRADLPLTAFEGVQIEIQIVTARGTLRLIRAMVARVLRGQSDGGLCLYQLVVVDPLYLLRQRRGRRVFRNQSAIEITSTVLDQVRRSAPRLGRAFDYVLQLDESLYPQREFTLQADESVAQFLMRVWKRAGISFFFRPNATEGGSALELVLFDDAWQLAPNVAGELKYHRLDGTETADTIVLWAEARRLTSGSVQRHSWNYKSGRMDEVNLRGLADQGEAGDEIAAFLRDMQTERPHDGDSLADFERASGLRMSRHEYEAACVYGFSGSRDIQVGEWNAVAGHDLLALLSPEERSYVFTEVHHRGDNNLKQIGPRAQKLLERSAHLPGWERGAPFDDPSGDDSDNDSNPIRGNKYLNRFTAVQRGAVRLVPRWNPREDLPPMHAITAIVSGPDGQEVHTDELGRYKVTIQGLDPEEHASGAGTSGSERDSAWLRMGSLYAGQGVGLVLPLRAGMECQLEFAEGDPDRPFIARVLYAGVNPLPRFDHLGSLPNNRAQAGIVTREFNGTQQNQLRFVDSAGHISVQLASDHAATQFNAGALGTPMNEGKSEPRGEGFEIRTDESGAIRTAKSLLISAWAQLRAIGKQLEAPEPRALLQDFLNLFRSLGAYGAQHQGMALDDAPAAELMADVAAAAAGSNTQPQGVGGKPTISISAPAGIATTTPKTLLSYAGINIDSVAQQHYQVTAGQHYSINAGKGISLFSHHDGLKAIAHHGQLLLQSQHDGIEANAATDIRWTATNGKLVGMAKEIMLIAEDGSFIKLGGGGITLGSQGAIAQKASSFAKDGPATMSVDLPTFGESNPDQKFLLRFGDASSPIAGLTPYEIKMSDGSVKRGTSDAQGLTDLLQRDAMHIAQIRLLNPEH